MSKCPFCNSENIDILITDYIHKRLKDRKPYHTNNLIVTPDPYNSADYAYDKILCKNCGQITKSLHSDSLLAYNKDHNNFFN
jgi:hypothetical protein